MARIPESLKLTSADKVMGIEDKLLPLLSEPEKNMWREQDKQWLLAFVNKNNTIRYWGVTKNAPPKGRLVCKRKCFDVYLTVREEYTGGKSCSYRKQNKIHLVPKKNKKKEC